MEARGGGVGGGRGKRNGSRRQREAEGEGKQEVARDDNSCDAQINALDCFLSDAATEPNKSHSHTIISDCKLQLSSPHGHSLL